MKTVIIDNYDSFTYNLCQLVSTVSGHVPQVIKNDEMTYDQFLTIECDNIIISPGPGRPDRVNDFGICLQLIQQSNKPILGVCLGHQGLAYAFSAQVVHAPQPMHGRVTDIYHHGHPLFTGIPNQFRVTRYHSLIVEKASLPECLEVIAETKDGLIMAIAHKEKPLYGVQFHPESIVSEYGEEIIGNFNRMSSDYNTSHYKKSSELLTLHSKKIHCKINDSVLFQNAFSQAENCVWLDSSLPNQTAGRFSFMGSLGGPLSHRIAYDAQHNITLIFSDKNTKKIELSIFDYLKQQLDSIKVKPNQLPFAFQGGFIGYFGYEAGNPASSLNHLKQIEYDAQFLFIDRFVVIDHQENIIYFACLDKEAVCDSNADWINELSSLVERKATSRLATQKLQKSTAEAIRALCTNTEEYLLRDTPGYLSDIACCQRYIADGESYEICLTNKIKKIIPALDLLDYYQYLRRHSPTAYSSFLRFSTLSVASSSMERFLSITSEGDVEAKPIKGTLARTEDKANDMLLAQQLIHDEKFFAENLMIVDLLRNDLAKVCEAGSVHVPNLMNVESYTSVHQLVSTIRGKLRKDLSAIDCIKSAFPGGSITGAPKMRTMELIAAIEKEARGIYTGAIGYLSLNGAIDFSIVIRTASQDRDEVTIGIGGAIIAMSNPQEEYDETLLKSNVLIKSFHQLLKDSV